MKIQNFSIVSGTSACDAHCPFCVSKMTGLSDLPKEDIINEAKFKKALLMAERHEAQSVLITGKGEPTLYPHQISRYLTLLETYDCKIPFIELQTNGIQMGRLANGEKSVLDRRIISGWSNSGLDIIALSIAHYKNKKNSEIYCGDYPDLRKNIEFILSMGFQIRLCVMMMDDFIDCFEEVKKLISFCKENGVFQLTIRPIKAPDKTENSEVSKYTLSHTISDDMVLEIRNKLNGGGTLLRKLIHGANVYEYDGQNICLADCLTIDTNSEDIRSLIFYPDGKISYDWQYKSARFL